MTMEETIAELVHKYERETNKGQSEADVRAGYIDLLFNALGWNVYNDPAGDTKYRREGYIRGAGIADVGLEIAGQPVLMLEAKKFGALVRSGERVGDRSLEEKQLFRYARAKGISYCILTNFERLQVFNADHERLVLWFDDPQEFLTRLPELLHLSPDKVQAGSLPSTERQLEIKPVDQEFLALLQDWRLRLANVIYQHNADKPVLKNEDSFDFGKLMAAVQRLLDRLILIRFADDKEVLLVYDVIENILSDYRKRGAYAKPDYLMWELTDFSHVMDDHHNTTLFKPGHICEQVFIPNDVLEKIMAEINNISFRKFSSDILGNTYETYLGTKLVLKNRVIVSEERTDIRKAGGIYYTPAFIVHYMVDNALGNRLKELGKGVGLGAIEKVKEIKVVDPACGSGSFLIYAYHVLADYYRRTNAMIEHERLKLLAGGAGADMFQRMEMFKGLPQPLIDYPHHILEKQLYGVDLDPEAAEIAAVNLTMQAFSDTKQEKLPLILNENIKVGNSLVSGTEDELRKAFGNTWREQKPFNWKEEFPEIMANGGFDIVIGNPPYGADIDNLLDFLKPYYADIIHNYAETYKMFFKMGLNILKPSGTETFITPNTFLTQPRYKDLRAFLLKQRILRIVNLGENVFEQCVVPVCLTFVSKSTPSKSYLLADVREKSKFTGDLATIHFREVPLAEVLSFGDLNLFPGETLRKGQIYFDEALEIKDAGIQYHRSGIGLRNKGGNDLYQRIFSSDPHEFKNSKHVWYGKLIDRYSMAEETDKYFNLDFRNVLRENESVSFSRESFDKTPRIVWRQTASRLQATIDLQRRWFRNTIQCAYLKPEYADRLDIKYILGIMNSKYIAFLYNRIVQESGRVFPQVKITHVKKLPLPVISPEIQSQISAYVVRILAAKKLQSEADTITLENEIDQLVYQLYELTEEEIGVVEGSGR